MNKPGWLRRDRWGESCGDERDGRSWGVEGHELGGGGPSARNNKQAFSYSNKYQASGELQGAADKETRAGVRLEDGFPSTLKPI